MSLFDQNVQGLSELLGKRRRMKGVTGRLDVNGLVEPNPTIDLDPAYVWVRLKGERSAIAVLNVNVTTQRANVPVILEEMDNGVLQVLSVDPEDAAFTYGVFAPALNMPDRIPEQDKSSIPHKRIKDLRLRLSSSGGLILYLEPGTYQKVNGDLVAWNGGTTDLTGSLPASVNTKRIVLIGITTSTNTIVRSSATAVVSSTAPTEEPWFTLADFVTARNAAASGVLWLWGTGLLYGETTIPNTDRFIDLRAIALEEPTVYTVTASSPLASSGGSAPNISLTGIVPIANGGTGQSSKTPAFDALSPTSVKGDVIAYDGADNVRLPVGATNGMVLSVDSSTATGLAWTATGSTFQATLSTTDDTVTPLISYTVAELVGVTIAGRIVATLTDKTAAFGASFRVTFRRQTGGNVSLVGAGYIESDDDSAGTPAITFNVNVGTQTGVIEWQGILAENWSVKAQYQVVTV